MRHAFVSLLLLLVSTLAMADGQYGHTFAAVAADQAISQNNTAITIHKITWQVIGSLSGCTVALDTSADGSSWTPGGAIPGQTCTSNGSSNFFTASANFVRINVTALTGTGSVNVTWNGYINLPGVSVFVDVFNTTNSGQGDMCARIKAAASLFGSLASSNTATLDARGFTGVQVCSAANATTMLDTFRYSKNVGGVLLLGNVALYADGPTGNNFSDSFSSVAGTPAFIIPSNFTVQGMGRGGPQGNNPPTNTVIGICNGVNTPVTGCAHTFPKRELPIASENYFNVAASTGSSSVTGAGAACTPNSTSGIKLCAMMVTISSGGPFVVGGNGSDPGSGFVTYIKNLALGTGEAVSLQNTQATPADVAGTFILAMTCTGAGAGTGNIPAARCPDSNTIMVPVKAGTVVCSTHCGNIEFYTPVIGFAPPGGNSYTATINFTGASSFGQVLKYLAIDMDQVPYAEGIRNFFAQENGGIDSVDCVGLSGICYEEGTNNEQNFGPIFRLQTSAGSSNTTCGPHTTGLFLHSQNINRGIYGFTVSLNNGCNTGAPRALAGVMVDTVDRTIADTHVESPKDCFLLGANVSTGNITLITPTGGPGGFPCDNVVHVSNMNSTNTQAGNSDYAFLGINREGSTNTVLDDQLSNTISDPKTASYIVDFNSGGTQFSLMTTSPSIQSLFNSGMAFQNCASAGGTCGSASAGSVAITNPATTVTVSTTAVKANSVIFVWEDATLGTKLGVTCNATPGRTYLATTRTANTSFIITASATPAANSACLNYVIFN